MTTKSSRLDERPAGTVVPAGQRWPWRTPMLLAGPAVLLLVGVFLTPMLTLGEFTFHRFEGSVSSPELTGSEWTAYFSDPHQWRLVVNTVQIGALSVAGCVLVGYPTALALHRVRTRAVRLGCYFLLFAPLVYSAVARTYGWSLILGDAGFLNSSLTRLGIVDEPIRLLYDLPAVIVGIVHILLPIMVLPIMASLRQIDDELLKAAADLGAPRSRCFVSITLPLSLPGLIAGAQLCFALVISTFATVSLLGGGRVQVLATGIYRDVTSLNWPVAAIGSYVLVALALLAMSGLALVQRLVPGGVRR